MKKHCSLFLIAIKVYSNGKDINVTTTPVLLIQYFYKLIIYNKEYYNFTIADIENLTDIHIKRNKRNGKKQAEHLRAEY